MGLQEDVKKTFEEMGKRFQESDLGNLTATYLFKLGDEGGEWTVKFVDGKGEVAEGAPEQADCTVTVSAENFLKIVRKEANAQMMFMTGKLKVAGNMGLAMKLQKVLG